MVIAGKKMIIHNYMSEYLYASFYEKKRGDNARLMGLQLLIFTIFIGRL